MLELWVDTTSHARIMSYSFLFSRNNYFTVFACYLIDITTGLSFSVKIIINTVVKLIMIIVNSINVMIMTIAKDNNNIENDNNNDNGNDSDGNHNKKQYIHIAFA